MTASETTVSAEAPQLPSQSTGTAPEPTAVVLEQWTLDLFDPIAQKAGFVDYTVVPSSGSNVGDGFMGIMLRVLIRGRRNGREDELSLMLKMPPTSKARQKAFNSAIMFGRESYVYREIFPSFVDFQRSKGLDADDADGFNRFPICHANVADAELDRYAIVMEDLKAGQYEMFDKFKTIDLDHIRLVVSEMAKLHAVSFAMRDQRPDVFEPYTGLKCVFLEYLIKQQKQMMEGFQKTIFDATIDALKPDELELRRKVAVLRDNFIEHMEDCVQLRKEREPLGVLNHGDCWNNNMMYLYENGSAVPQKICLIDFQIARFASPVLDLVYFLFTSTIKDVRAQHMDTIWDIYYTQLARTITRLGSDPEQLYSRVTFDQERRRYGKFGVLIAPMLLQVITAPATDLPDMDQISKDLMGEAEQAPQMHLKGAAMAAFNVRITDVIRDADAYGFLDF